MEDFYSVKSLTAAQKKKLKKKQKQYEIELEKDSLKSTNSDKSQEEKILSVQLAIYGFKIYSIPGDGNCLYRAIAHQLDPDSKDLHEKLRIKTSEFILENKEEFRNYISDDIDEYVNKITSENEWGGEVEIMALSRALNCKIFVHSVRYKEPICHGDLSSDGNDIHLVFYESAYSVGGHYNSVESL